MTTSKRIRVFMVDDHPIVHDGLKGLLLNDQKVDIIGHAQSGKDALDMIRGCQPDVILLDISMPGMSGLEAIPLLKKIASRAAIVIFSMHEKEALIQRAFNLGALGFVLKGSASGEVVAAIWSAYQGEYFLSSQIEMNVIQNFLKNCETRQPVSKYDALTEREQQVFRLMVEGKSTLQIGKALFIAIKTVEKHRSNVMKKLGVNDPISLVKYAIQIGVIDPYS